MRSLVIAAVVALSAVSVATSAWAPGYDYYSRHPMAVPHCTHGQQLCGHTCIAKSKVCHVPPAAPQVHPGRPG
jgi:hypothetical protein